MQDEFRCLCRYLKVSVYAAAILPSPIKCYYSLQTSLENEHGDQSELHIVEVGSLMAQVHLRSCLWVVRMPSRINGRALTQVLDFGKHFSDDFSYLWNHSTSPFAMWWYDVRILCEPKSCISCIQRDDSNCWPLSVVIVESTPKREIQLLRKLVPPSLRYCH